MARITRHGRDLAWSLNSYIGTTGEIQETCSLLARHEKTYRNIQELWCNVEMSDSQVAYWEHREELLERRITDLVDSLPQHDDGPWRVVFQGDPRGRAVYLVGPGGREIPV